MKTACKRILCIILIAAIALPCSLISASAADISESEAPLMGRGILLQMPNGAFLADVYDRLYACMKNLDPSVDVTDGVHYINSREAQTIHKMLKSDHPEIFWVSGYSYSYNSNGLIKILPGYTMTKTEAASATALVEAAADKLCSGLYGLSEYEISLALHDRLADSVDYRASENDQTVYGALVDGVAVCAGYSAAYQYLMQKMGIAAFTVTGVSMPSNSTEYIAHAWNLVNLSGEYYYTDVTWDDQTSSGGHIFHDFFNVTDEKLSKSHIPDNVYVGYLPECTATAENYFVRGDAVLTEFDAEKIAYLLRRGGYTANMYATVGAREFIPVIKEHIWDIADCLNLQGGFSYGFMYLSNEIVFYIKSDNLPKDFLTVNVTLLQNAGITYTAELYTGDALVYSVTSKETTVLFDDLSFGDYTLKIVADGYYIYTTEVNVMGSTALDVKLRLLGDINGDDTVNAKDSNLQKLLLFAKIFDPELERFADLNGDGKINTKDRYILRACLTD